VRARQVSHANDRWRARCRETGTAGSGRGPLKKDLLTGTSSAAYRYRTAAPRIMLGEGDNAVGVRPVKVLHGGREGHGDVGRGDACDGRGEVIAHGLGQGCGKPIQNCMAMGAWAVRAIEDGSFKQVLKKEAIEIKREAESHGMVNWIMNIRSTRGQCAPGSKPWRPRSLMRAAPGSCPPCKAWARRGRWHLKATAPAPALTSRRRETSREASLF